MNRLLTGAIALALGTIPVTAQSLGDQNIQIHGFATQAYVVSDDNNYLGMDTRTGAPSWTEAAVNVNDQVSDKLRVGIQLHYTRLGAFGGDNLNVDWALGDYQANQWVGIRAGKVKIRWGLLNDTQDYDPGYLWSLLPESIYGIDIRATNLSQLGAELYGKLPLQRKFGRLNYSAYYGYYYYADNDGYRETMSQSGLVFDKMPGGKTPGLDVRWETPVRGLKAGGSLMIYNAKGNLTNGTYTAPYAYWPTGYAQYDFKKFFSSYQYAKLVSYQTATVSGSGPVTTGSDCRQWFAMGGYHLTEKFQAGAYYSKYTVPSAGDNSDPANHFKDWVVSGRYDFNSDFYGKIEGHFIDGNALGFYGLNNPNGLKPKTNVMVAKIGFTF
jgi:hypothetical protein